MTTTVPYEASVVPSEGTGVTVYDDCYPINAPQFHGTDDSFLISDVVASVDNWERIDWEIGGETGAADRNAYTLGGIANYSDAHDFRGNHALIPARDGHGALGDVGWDDYANQYANAVASDGYPDVTKEESWDNISAAY